MATSSPRPWYRIQNAADDPSVADIHIIDFIGDWIDDYWGFGVTAKAFVEQLSKLDASVKAIRVHINSPGGDVFAAVNIANALRDQGAKGRHVMTIVDGLAASAASIVMMAGVQVRIADNAMVFVHNPWSIGIGSAADMRKLADDLDTIRNVIVATYKWHSELSDDELMALMDAETWMDADEAIANGFATEKAEGLRAAASLSPQSIAKLSIPDKYRARVEALLVKPVEPPKAASALDIVRACREADCSELAEDLIAANATAEQVQTRVAASRQQKQQAAARATEIRAICEKANLPTLADAYVKSGMLTQDVRDLVTTITALLDQAEIDTNLHPDHRGAKPQAAISHRDVYAERNRPQTKP